MKEQFEELRYILESIQDRHTSHPYDPFRCDGYSTEMDTKRALEILEYLRQNQDFI